jgi:hypothetical protein
MMPEDESAPPSVYRMMWTIRIVYLLIGGTFLFLGFKALESYFQAPWGPLWVLWVFAIVFPVVGITCLLSPFFSCVVLDRDSLTLKGVLRDQRLPRAAIAGIRVYEDDGYYCAIFIAPKNKPRKLTIPLIYRFDRRWQNWTSTLDKVESPHRFGFLGWRNSGK